MSQLVRLADFDRSSLLSRIRLLLLIAAAMQVDVPVESSCDCVSDLFAKWVMNARPRMRKDAQPLVRWSTSPFNPRIEVTFKPIEVERFPEILLTSSIHNGTTRYSEPPESGLDMLQEES